MSNKLASETSPYLLQHAENPVEWYPWGEQALTLARQQNKPILLSIGYSACHWCHVMAHESFEDEATAMLMNQHFINIKVDREERPDLDQIYQSAHNMLSNQSGGWPLTMFLTPEQQPFFSGTYFPKTPRYQLPGFGDLIVKIAAFYHQRKADLQTQNLQLMQAMARTVPSPSDHISANQQTLEKAFQDLHANFDFEHGGFGRAPKFPNPADITFLLHCADDGNQQAESMALQMLSSMAAGGIYDQIGGGFCRYSVDERWHIPHFEKMLYDNGQLLGLYADAWQLCHQQDQTQAAQFKSVAEETVTWLMRELRSPQGAFYSSLDADSVDAHGHSEEGAFYVWQADQVKALLSAEEFVVLSRRYGLDRSPNFEGKYWHFYLAAPAFSEESALLQSAKAKLFKAREQRHRPALDDKILSSWNALMIKGLAKAGNVFARADWIEAAQQATDFIRQNLWKNHRLLATCKDGKAHLNAYLDDYAFMLDALICLMQAEFRQVDQDFAIALADALLEEFESDAGGFYFTGHHHESLIHRPKSAYDNATPSGNGIAAISLQRLGHLLNCPRYTEAAERSLKAFDRVMQTNPAACAHLLMALQEYHYPPSLIVLRGNAADLNQWRDDINSSYRPHVLAVYLPNSLGELTGALARPLTEGVNAWLCRGVECMPAIQKCDELLRNL